MDVTRYSLTITGCADPEYAIFKMFKEAPESKHHLDENGKTIGEYDWRSLETDMRTFSAKMPDALFIIVESGTYGSESFESRHYFKNGAYAHIEPKIVVSWPTFTEDLLK